VFKRALFAPELSKLDGMPPSEVTLVSFAAASAVETTSTVTGTLLAAVEGEPAGEALLAAAIALTAAVSSRFAPN
jgi:hypothetical protein